MSTHGDRRADRGALPTARLLCLGLTWVFGLAAAAATALTFLTDDRLCPAAIAVAFAAAAGSHYAVARILAAA